LSRAAVDLEAIVGAMLTDLAATETDVKSIYKVGLNTTRFLLASGDVVIGYLLLRGASVAAEKLTGASGQSLSAKDTAFYQGKIAAAKFFTSTVLPALAVERGLAENIDASVMDLDEAAF
jgi:hypothetical protein